MSCRFKKTFPWFCFALFLASCAPPAGPVHVGLGASTATVKNDADGVDASSGGVALSFGWEFAQTWSLEFFASLGHSVPTGVPQNIYYPPDSAEHGVLLLGVRKALWSLDDHRWTPWLEIGYGYAELYWNTFYYRVSGDGLAGAVGADVKIGELPLFLRAQFMPYDFSATDTYGDAAGSISGSVFSALIMYRFR